MARLFALRIVGERGRAPGLRPKRFGYRSGDRRVSDEAAAAPTEFSAIVITSHHNSERRREGIPLERGFTWARKRRNPAACCSAGAPDVPVSVVSAKVRHIEQVPAFSSATESSVSFANANARFADGRSECQRRRSTWWCEWRERNGPAPPAVINSEARRTTRFVLEERRARSSPGRASPSKSSLGNEPSIFLSHSRRAPWMRGARERPAVLSGSLCRRTAT